MRDLIEYGFHLALPLLVWGPAVGLLDRRRWLRWLIGSVLVLALAWHLAFNLQDRLDRGLLP